VAILWMTERIDKDMPRVWNLMAIETSEYDLHCHKTLRSISSIKNLEERKFHENFEGSSLFKTKWSNCSALPEFRMSNQVYQFSNTCITLSVKLLLKFRFFKKICFWMFLRKNKYCFVCLLTLVRICGYFF